LRSSACLLRSASRVHSTCGVLLQIGQPVHMLVLAVSFSCCK
jgi:hypothetical protein